MKSIVLAGIMWWIIVVARGQCNAGRCNAGQIKQSWKVKYVWGGNFGHFSIIIGINNLIFLFHSRYMRIQFNCRTLTVPSAVTKNLRIQIQMLPGLIFHRDTKSKGRAHYYCIIVRAPGFVSILDYLPFRNNLEFTIFTRKQPGK